MSERTVAAARARAIRDRNNLLDAAKDALGRIKGVKYDGKEGNHSPAYILGVCQSILERAVAEVES